MTTATAAFSADYALILQALAARARYRYVQPRVLRHAAGWRIASPNCSRNIDPQGGEIPIAWLQPVEAAPDGTDPVWRLLAYRHHSARWEPVAEGLSLSQALERLCIDAQRDFWP